MVNPVEQAVEYSGATKKHVTRIFRYIRHALTLKMMNESSSEKTRGAGKARLVRFVYPLASLAM